MKFKKLMESLAYNPEAKPMEYQDEMNPAEAELESIEKMNKPVQKNETFDRALNEEMFATPKNTDMQKKALAKLEKLLNQARK